MNRKIILAVAAAAALFASPASADYIIKDGNSNIQTIRSGTVAGKILPYMTPTDAAGVAFGTVTNPFAIQFGTGALLPSFAVPQHVICDSGCSGGGGGGLSVPFAGPIGANGTPGGFKDGSGNLQPLLGDITNGQWISIKASITIPVSGAFFQATQPISAASLPLPTGAATQTTSAAILAALGTPFQAGGSIANTAFGISGTLPAFAATPTFNLGTLNGAATAANQASVIGSAAAGTAAANSQLAGAIFNSSPITVTTGQQASLQSDANGYLKVNVVLGGGGSATFGATFPATGVALGVSQGGNLVAVTGTAGNLNVQCANCSGSGVSTADKAAFVSGTSIFAGGGGFFQTTATANPLTTGQQGMFQVTAQRAMFSNLRDSSGTELGVAAGPLQVSLANTAANGTAISISGTVTANLGTIAGVATQTTLASILTNLGSPFQAGGSIGNTSFAATQVSAAALNATVVGTGTFAVQASIATATAWGINTLGSTTSGQSGQLALCAVTTAAPTYVTAQSNALSCNTGGLLRVDGSGVTQPVSLTSTTITGTVAVTQSGAWSLTANQSVNVAQINGVAPLMGNGVTGTGSQRVTIASDNTAFAVNAAATLAAETTKVIGTTRNLGNAGAIIDFAGQNATSPANSWLIGGQFQTTPTTITPGNSSPLQLDNAGNLLVNIKAGASSGAVAQGSTTSGQTGGLTQAAVLTAAPTYVTGQTSPLNMTTGGGLRVADIAAEASLATIATNSAAANPINLNTVVTAQTGLTPGASASSQTGTIVAANIDLSSVAGVAVGVPANYGTSPGAVKVQGVNAFVTNTVANNTAQVNGVTVLTGTGATGTGAQRVTVSVDQATNAGAALKNGGVGVVNGAATFQAVAASATATSLGTTGAIGDYLSHCDIYPTSTSPGVVTIFDNTNTAANSVILFPGGASSLSNLAPFPIPVGATSAAGGWKVTTGANVSVVCVGKFT